MSLRHAAIAALASAGLFALGAPQALADGLTVHDAANTVQTTCAKNVAGVLHPCAVDEGMQAGAPTPLTIDPADNGVWMHLLNLPPLAATSTLQTAANGYLSSLVANLGSPFQAGGSIGNTQFGATESGAWTVGISGTPTFNLGALNGAATAANQATANTTLASILSAFTGLASSANQATSNTALAAIQSELTGVSTAANQATANTTLASILTQLASQATAANQTSEIAQETAAASVLGAKGDTACATDTSSCSLNALIQRLNQRLTSLITALNTPMQQTGGSVAITGTVSALAPQASVTETTVTMNGTWQLVWTAAAAKRVVIGFASNSNASGDYSFNASLAGATTTGGIPFANGLGGSFDFTGGVIPNTSLYVKGTSGSTLTVQVFN
ncbi:MAG TPA: hypothetical protein VMU59_11505 [Caulobacteraceae bacterium]|nr:hypothetical protein [Caulobacteraceae bacterium]